MKIGNFFVASFFLQSFLIVSAEEKKKTEVNNTCHEYAARNKPFKVEYEIKPNEPITDQNASISFILSFGSDQQCIYESNFFETGSEECHSIQSSPKITFDGTKCVLEFNETSNVNTLIKEKHRQHHKNTFM